MGKEGGEFIQQVLARGEERRGVYRVLVGWGILKIHKCARSDYFPKKKLH